MTDYCSELQALVDACESFADPISGHRIHWQTALDRARAALAEPEPEGPTDEKLTLTYSLAVAAAVDGTSKPWPADLCERAQLAGLRAVLARWGSNNISRSI